VKKEIAARWVAALRSGEYKQTRGKLRRTDSFCCLGVLCDVYRKDVGGSWVDREAHAYFAATDFDASPFCAPLSVERWAGLTDADTSKYADTMNDENRESFAEIADAIERDAGLISGQP
jgi:hypothetical protein